LHDAGASDGQESSGKQFGVFRLISETDLPPLDRRSDSSLSGVVGGFRAPMIQEGEQVGPMLEETSGCACHIMIRGHLLGLKTIADSCSDWDRLFHKGVSVHVPVLEGLPQGEHAADVREHPFCEAYAIRAPACMFEPPEGPDDMGRADLSRTLVVCVVGREHVRADDTAEDFAKDPFEDFCSSRGCQGEESHGRGHENPKPDPLAHAFPPLSSTLRTLCLGRARLISSQHGSRAWETSS
jgi:hypothetical protein